MILVHNNDVSFTQAPSWGAIQIPIQIPRRKSEVISMRFILLASFRRRVTKTDTDKTDAIIKANPQVKVISIDWVLGRYDGVMVAEAPDEETWLRDAINKIIEHHNDLVSLIEKS